MSLNGFWGKLSESQKIFLGAFMFITIGAAGSQLWTTQMALPAVVQVLDERLTTVVETLNDRLNEAEERNLEKWEVSNLRLAHVNCWIEFTTRGEDTAICNYFLRLLPEEERQRMERMRLP